MLSAPSEPSLPELNGCAHRECAARAIVNATMRAWIFIGFYLWPELAYRAIQSAISPLIQEFCRQRRLRHSQSKVLSWLHRRKPDSQGRLRNAHTEDQVPSQAW